MTVGYLIKGQPICNPSTMTPTDVFYANSVSNYTAPGGYLYLCGSNTTVYDTTLINSFGVIFINPNCNYFFCRSGGTAVPCEIFAKNNSTVTIKSTYIPNSAVICYEPLATIINQSTSSINTYSCASITFPTVNCFAGIKENTFDNLFLVSPNPSVGNLNIVLKNDQYNYPDIFIKNQLGQTVLEYLHYDLTKGEISLENLNSGIYYLCFKTPEALLSKKISIQK